MFSICSAANISSISSFWACCHYFTHPSCTSDIEVGFLFVIFLHMSTLFERVHLLGAASGRKMLCLISGSFLSLVCAFFNFTFVFFNTFMVKCECCGHSDTLFHVKLRCVHECIQPGWIPSEPLSKAPPTDQSNLCCPVDLHSRCHVCCLRPARLHSLLHVKVNLDRVHGSEDGRSLSSPPLSPPLSCPSLSLCPSALPRPLLSILFSVFFHFPLEPELLLEVLLLLPLAGFHVISVPHTCIPKLQMFAVTLWLCLESTIFINYLICVIKCLQIIRLSVFLHLDHFNSNLKFLLCCLCETFN